MRRGLCAVPLTILTHFLMLLVAAQMQVPSSFKRIETHGHWFTQQKDNTPIGAGLSYETQFTKHGFHVAVPRHEGSSQSKSIPKLKLRPSSSTDGSRRQKGLDQTQATDAKSKRSNYFSRTSAGSRRPASSNLVRPLYVVHGCRGPTRQVETMSNR